MSDIKYQTAIYLNQNQDLIKEVTENFRTLSCRIMSDTLIQLDNFNLIEKYIDLNDYVMNGDITETTIKKMIELMEETKSYLSSKEYEKKSDILKMYSQIQTKLIQENKHLNENIIENE